MQIHDSTKALQAEIEQPTVLAPADFFRAARDFRQRVSMMSAQVSRLQHLVVDVEEDEQAQLIRGKLERIHSKLRAIDRTTTEAERRYQALARCVRSLFDDVLPDAVKTIEAVQERSP